MSEFQPPPATIIDGKPVPYGRSRQRKDGSYSAYDLTEAQVGDMMTVATWEGVYDFVKDAPGGALDGWKHTDGRQALGSTLRLTLLETNNKGPASIRTNGVVIRENLEVSVVETEPDIPHVVRNLGAVASILILQHADIKASDKVHSA